MLPKMMSRPYYVGILVFLGIVLAATGVQGQEEKPAHDHHQHAEAPSDDPFTLPQDSSRIITPDHMLPEDLVASVDPGELPFLDAGSGKLIVLLFLGTDCPISQKFMNTIRSLHESYQEDVAFYALFPDNFSLQQIREFEDSYQLGFPAIADRGNAVAEKLRATITPEAFLIREDGSILFQGAISNWFYELGKSRRQPTEHYLEDGIRAAVSGKVPEVRYAPAIGCFIEL